MTEDQQKMFDKLDRAEQAAILQIMLLAGTGTNKVEIERLVSSLSVGGRRLLTKLMIDGLNQSEIQEKKKELTRATEPIKRDAVRILIAILQNPEANKGAHGVAIADSAIMAIKLTQQIHDHF
jgi:hypothetical protein